MKKAIRILFLLFLIPISGFAFESSLPPLVESAAYKQFSRQPANDLSKLIFLLNRFKDAKVQVIYDQHQYDAIEASRLAKDYLRRNYHKEPAEYWVRNYCSKTKKGNLIYLKDGNGKLLPAIELALQELKALDSHRGS